LNQNPAQTPAASAELKARILAAVQASPSPTRRPTFRATRLLVPAAAVFAGCLYVAFDGIHHGQGRPPGALGASVSVWIGAALVSMWTVVGKARSPTGRPRPWLLAVTIGMPVLVLALLITLSAVGYAGDAATHRAGVRCLGMTLAAAVVPVLGLLLLKRGSDPVHPAAHGAAIGVSFGAYAGIMVCLWCPDLSPAHSAVGHVAPLVLLALLGAAVGRRVLDLPRESHTNR
jgi:hypothetical protein